MTEKTRVVLVFRERDRWLAVSRQSFRPILNGKSLSDEEVPRGLGHSACNAVMRKFNLPGKASRNAVRLDTKASFWSKKKVLIRIFLVDARRIGTTLPLKEGGCLQPLTQYPNGRAILARLENLDASVGLETVDPVGYTY